MSVQDDRQDHHEDNHSDHRQDHHHDMNDLDILEKRIHLLENKIQIQEIFKSQEVEEIVERWVRHNVCSMISIGVSIVSWASMAAQGVSLLYK